MSEQSKGRRKPFQLTSFPEYFPNEKPENGMKRRNKKIRKN
jgi:hypothetical protein